MTQEEIQEKIENIREQIYTPEPFSPQWSAPSELLDISLDFPYSAQEWDVIFEALIDLLNHADGWIRDSAIDKLVHALEMEESQASNCEDYKPKPIEQRVKRIFEAIATQALIKPNIFETFCSKFRFLAREPTYKRLVLGWLNQLVELDDRQAPTSEAILAAQILFGAYDSTWQETSAALLEMLDHADLTIRACAAYQIGKFYKQKSELEQTSNQQLQADSTTVSLLNKIRATRMHQQAATDGMPPLDQIMSLIRDKEIERPGVAGAFWDVIPKTGINTKEWLLKVLKDSPSAEPYIRYFPCNLAFDAHERFSRDAGAVRRLIDMGRVGLALDAATDTNCKIDALEPLLIEIGNHNEPEFVRIAAWQLAYHYHYLHPHGANLGYVELIDRLPEIELFLLFRREKEPESPYAVVIYPKSTNQNFSRAIAQKWVNQVFPEEVRGTLRKDSLPGIHRWYQRGYVEYCVSDQHTESELVDNVIIGYRSKFLWNPQQFL